MVGVVVDTVVDGGGVGCMLVGATVNGGGWVVGCNVVGLDNDGDQDGCTVVVTCVVGCTVVGAVDMVGAAERVGAWVGAKDAVGDPVVTIIVDEGAMEGAKELLVVKVVVVSSPTRLALLLSDSNKFQGSTTNRTIAATAKTTKTPTAMTKIQRICFLLLLVLGGCCGSLLLLLSLLSCSTSAEATAEVVDM